MLAVQEVEDEDGDCGNGAVGEIEDPGGLVGQDQAGPGQAVYGAGRDADDDKRKKFRHELRMPPRVLSPNFALANCGSGCFSGQCGRPQPVTRRDGE